MVTSFPRANLDPASDEWRRAVEKLIREALGGASKARREVRAYGSGQSGIVESIASQATTISEQAETIAAHAAEVAPSDPPFPPSAPTLTSSLGSVVADWDGLLLRQEQVDDPPTPEPPLAGFLGVRAEILVSRVPDEEIDGVFAEEWTPAGQSLRAAGAISISDRPVGSEVEVRFIAFNAAGESVPSEPASITVQGVVSGDITSGAVIADNIAANAVGTTQLVNGAVTREILAAQAVGPNEIADFAITARKFNTSAHILY